MLTEEQLKNLKKGDKLIAEVSFSSVCKDNDLICNTPFTNNTGDVVERGAVFHPSCLTLPPTKPKYDPTRRFKKGDIVRVVEWNGRDMVRIGMEGRVVEDELRSKVELAIDGWTRGIFYLACHLELVTPVEELEPYSVETDQYGFHIERHDGEVLATYNDNTHPDAYEAAVAECKRLTEEWRKEHESNI